MANHGHCWIEQFLWYVSQLHRHFFRFVFFSFTPNFHFRTCFQSFDSFDCFVMTDCGTRCGTYLYSSVTTTAYDSRIPHTILRSSRYFHVHLKWASARDSYIPTYTVFNAYFTQFSNSTTASRTFSYFHNGLQCLNYYVCAYAEKGRECVSMYSKYLRASSRNG